MKRVTTEAWTLHPRVNGAGGPAELRRQEFDFVVGPEDVLAEPLFGSWEANMTHALLRDPIDVCKARREDVVVLGNSGVVRVLEVGENVSTLRAGNLCLIIAAEQHRDAHGYMRFAPGYDAPNTMGVLAKQIRVHHSGLFPLPAATGHSLEHWAAFAVRFVSAWSNWKVALACWRSQVTPLMQEQPYVWGWGGGVTLAELDLAVRCGARAWMFTSDPDRAAQISRRGIQPVDRSQLDLGAMCEPDAEKSRAALKKFRALIARETDRHGADIFVDNIGEPVYGATTKGLARLGVIATCGWAAGGQLSVLRPAEAIARHVHVFTHFGSSTEVREAVEFAESNAWIPDPTSPPVAWSDIGQFAQEVVRGGKIPIFPLFEVNG